jgi:hypothetical protein
VSTRAILEELFASAAAEAARLAELVDSVAERVAVAQSELELVADWPAERIELLRAALRRPRFADVPGYTGELERAEAELASVQELRRRLAGERT